MSNAWPTHGSSGHTVWINPADEGLEERAKYLLETEVAKMHNSLELEKSPEKRSSSPLEFEFESRRNQNSSEVTRFLENSEIDLKMLDAYPSIKAVYRKFNTILSSSAAPERMFSKAKLVFNSFNLFLTPALSINCF